MRSLPRRLGVAVVVAVIVVFLSVKLDTFRDYQIAEIAVEVTAVAGLTLLTGLSGQISLGHGAFMAIGGYTAALLLMHFNWPFIAVLVVAALAALLIPSQRRPGRAAVEEAAVGTLAMSGDAVTAETAAGETVASELSE